MFRSIYIFFRESFLIYAEVTKSVKLIQLKYLLRWLLQIISRLFILIFKCYWFCNFNIYKKRLPEGNIHKSKHVRVFIIQTNKCTIYIYINNILCIVSTPTCFGAPLWSHFVDLMYLIIIHCSITPIRQSRLYVQPPSYQHPCTVIVTVDSSLRFVNYILTSTVMITF